MFAKGSVLSIPSIQRVDRSFRITCVRLPSTSRILCRAQFRSRPGGFKGLSPFLPPLQHILRCWQLLRLRRYSTGRWRLNFGSTERKGDLQHLGRRMRPGSGEIHGTGGKATIRPSRNAPTNVTLSLSHPPLLGNRIRILTVIQVYWRLL